MQYQAVQGQTVVGELKKDFHSYGPSDVWIHTHIKGPAGHRCCTAKKCAGLHFHTHSMDEPGEPAYIACFECGHVYPSARALRRAHRRQIIAMGLPRRLFGDDWHGWLTFLRLLQFVRASRITFCQECLHDL